MISVAMLGGGGDAAGYYLDRSADCDPDLSRYYAGEREAPGVWCCGGAAALGLDGRVVGEGRQVFAALLDGRSPDGTVVAKPVWRSDPRGELPAAPLVRELRAISSGRGVEPADLFSDDRLGEVVDRLIARVEASPHRAHPVDARLIADLTQAVGLNPHALYPKAGKQPGFAAAFAHAGQRVDVRRCGLDVVASAPKSVSVLYGLGSPDVAATVLAAHERAVTEALGYLDRHAAHGRRGHEGDGQRCARIATDGFVAAAFTHRTSRADDPQLHTHLVIANAVRGADGQWSAVDSRSVHRHARTAGCVYQAVLRGELTRELGVEWGPVRKGVAEIVGIPKTVLRHFSTRRQAIERELDKTAGTTRKAAQRAAYVTRPAKTHTPDLPLRERWAERVRSLGHDPGELVDDSLHRVKPPQLPDVGDVARELFGPTGLTMRVTSFDRRDVIQALTESLPAGLPITGNELESAASRLLRDPTAIPLLQPEASTDDGPRYSTVELVATEHVVLRYADTETLVPTHRIDAARSVADAAGLTGDQRALVLGVLLSSATVDVVVGPAGSGKTALLRAAKHGWDGVGVPVVGCALAAVTARRLEAATGIASSSLTRFLGEPPRRVRRLGLLNQPASARSLL